MLGVCWKYYSIPCFKRKVCIVLSISAEFLSTPTCKMTSLQNKELLALSIHKYSLPLASRSTLEKNPLISTAIISVWFSNMLHGDRC